MLDATAFQIPDLSGLSPEAAQAATQAIEAHVNEQALQISRKDQELKFKNAKLEKLTFELARHKAWRFGAKTERMNAEQRQIFEETLAEDQASLETQIQALKGTVVPTVAPSQDKAKRPRRQALPEHLRRVDHHHEPESTLCPSPECGQAMTRVGEDVSERLDIVPAEFFVHRHIYGKWACRCCQLLVQEPAEPQIVESGIPSAGLVAHTLVSRFVDHLPYYRQETINARSGVHTPRSTLASWSGVGGAALEPLHEALKHFVLSSAVVQADETPVDMLDPGAGKTKKAYIWGYARGAFDPEPAVVYDFCTGRGGRFPLEFLGDWSGTLVRDEYKGYESVVAQRERKASGCLAHARRKYDELLKHNSSPVAAEAIERIAQIYRIERELQGLSGSARLAQRREHAGPLWKSLHEWLTLELRRVPEGSATAKAINYSLNHGACQGSCRLIHARRGALSSADAGVSMGSESRSGLSLTTAM